MRRAVGIRMDVAERDRARDSAHARFPFLRTAVERERGDGARTASSAARPRSATQPIRRVVR